MQDLDEVDPDRLHSGKLIHFRQITTDKTKSTTVSHWDDSQIGDMFPLGSAHRKDLEKILAKYDGDTLAESLRGKKLKVEAFNIGLKEGATFEGVPGRRYSEKHSEVLKEWVDTMSNEGIIEPCPTTTTSPALVVPQEGKYRVTSDVTQLNKVMKTLQGNIPAIDGIVRWYARKKYKGVLDLLRAYFQCPASRDLRDLFAISTPHGNFRFTERLPMGQRDISVYFNNVIRMIFPLH